MTENFEIIEVNPLKNKKRTIVTGFSGAGFIGNTALMHIIRRKGLKLRYQLRTVLIPPMMVIINGKPLYSFRVYSDDKDQILFVVSESMVSAENIWPVGEKFMEWLMNKGIKEFISLEGLPFGALPKERIVFSFNTSKKDLSNYGIEPMNEGGVSGINAVLLDASIKHGVPWMSVFVPTPFMSTIDFGGVATAIEVLNKMLKLDVEVESLKRSDELSRQALERRMRGSSGFLSSLRRRIS